MYDGRGVLPRMARGVVWAAVAGMGAFVAVLIVGSTGNAEQPKAQPAQAQPQTRPAIASQADFNTVMVLFRTTLVAVHQANVTGNYTVLRDIAAPGFQEKNTSADLSVIFAALRQQRVDLAQVVVLEPKFSRPPELDQKNMLRLTGSLATVPAPVVFDLMFQPVNGGWRLFGISIRSVRFAARGQCGACRAQRGGAEHA